MEGPPGDAGRRAARRLRGPRRGRARPGAPGGRDDGRALPFFLFLSLGRTAFLFKLSDKKRPAEADGPPLGCTPQRCPRAAPRARPVTGSALGAPRWRGDSDRSATSTSLGGGTGGVRRSGIGALDCPSARAWTSLGIQWLPPASLSAARACRRSRASVQARPRPRPPFRPQPPPVVHHTTTTVTLCAEARRACSLQVLLSAEGKDFEIAEGSRREGDTGVGILIAPVFPPPPALPATGRPGVPTCPRRASC